MNVLALDRASRDQTQKYREGLIQIVRLDKYTALGAFVYLSCQQLLFVLSLINILVSTGQESSRTRAHERRRLLSGLPKEERGEACLHPGDAQQDDLGGGGYDGHEGHGYNGQDGHGCQDGYDGYAVCPVLIFPGKL